MPPSQHTYIHTYTRTYTHTYIHAYMHTCIHTYLRHPTSVCTYVHKTYIHAHIYIYKCICIYIYIYYIHTDIHIHINTNKQPNKHTCRILHIHTQFLYTCLQAMDAKTCIYRCISMYVQHVCVCMCVWLCSQMPCCICPCRACWRISRGHHCLDWWWPRQTCTTNERCPALLLPLYG